MDSLWQGGLGGCRGFLVILHGRGATGTECCTDQEDESDTDVQGSGYYRDLKHKDRIRDNGRIGANKKVLIYFLIS
jgi:hypothetical protein